MAADTRILLTGSSGYIAGWLGPALRDAGYSIVGLDRRGHDRPFLDSFHQGDLLDPETVRSALSGVEMVVHLAAAKGDWGISRAEYYRDNLEATRSLLTAARAEGIDRWLFFSTVATMGPSDSAVDEGADLEPINPYGSSKREAEELFRDFARTTDSDVLIVRPSVVYGPGNPASTNIYRLIDAIYHRRFVLVGQGETRKTTSYVENLVEATLFLLERQQPGVETYIYVDDPVRTTGDMVQQIYELLDRSGPAFQIPLPLAKPLAQVSDVAAEILGIDFPITGARIEKFCRSTYYDGSAIRDFGFRQPVDNEAALRRTVRWHLEHETDASDQLSASAG